eukprot:1133954-Amphidinium_carterae.1
MAYGGPAGDPKVTADLNTIRIWQRHLDAGRLEWPLEEKGMVYRPEPWQKTRPVTRARYEGPSDISVCWLTGLDGNPSPEGGVAANNFSKTFVATTRPNFAGLETGLSTQSFRHLKRACSGADDRSRSAVNAALGGVWHEARTHSAIAAGDLCVHCREEVKDLSHIMFRCPHWHKERRQVELPEDDAFVPHVRNFMGCYWLHWCALSYVMHVRWSTVQVFARFGQMGQDDTASRLRKPFKLGGDILIRDRDFEKRALLALLLPTTQKEESRGCFFFLPSEPGSTASLRWAASGSTDVPEDERPGGPASHPVFPPFRAFPKGAG